MNDLFGIISIDIYNQLLVDFGMRPNKWGTYLPEADWSLLPVHLGGKPEQYFSRSTNQWWKSTRYEPPVQ